MGLSPLEQEDREEAGSEPGERSEVHGVELRELKKSADFAVRLVPPHGEATLVPWSVRRGP